MKQDHHEIRNVINKILFEEYKLKTVSGLETLDGETLSEIYEALKCMQEE